MALRWRRSFWSKRPVFQQVLLLLVSCEGQSDFTNHTFNLECSGPMAEFRTPPPQKKLQLFVKNFSFPPKKLAGKIWCCISLKVETLDSYHFRKVIILISQVDITQKTDHFREMAPPKMWDFGFTPPSLGCNGRHQDDITFWGSGITPLFTPGILGLFRNQKPKTPGTEKGWIFWVATRVGANYPVFFFARFCWCFEKRFSFGFKFPGIVYLFEITDSSLYKLFISFYRRKRLGHVSWLVLYLEVMILRRFTVAGGFAQEDGDSK